MSPNQWEAFIYSIRSTSKSIHFEWDFNPLSLPDTAQLMVDSKSIDDKLKQIKQSITAIWEDNVDDNEFESLMVSHYSSGSWMSTLIICLISFTVLMALLFLGICFRNFAMTRGWIATSTSHSKFDMSYHRRRHESESDGDDEITKLARSSPPPRVVHQSGEQP